MRRAAFGLLLLLAACRHGDQVADDPDANKLPRIELPAVGAQDYSPDMLNGRVVLVHFTATWCFPCLEELPTMAALQNKYGSRGFQVIAIGMDREGRKVLEPFAYHYDLPFPVLVADEQYRNGQSRFGVIKVLPTNILFARDGNAIAGWSLSKLDEVEKMIEGALR
ncbi:MAG: TlpA disulfide reductase family protein [Myxococcaceae bacterium]